MYGWGDTPDTSNPVDDAVAQAKQRLGSAGLLGFGLLVGVAFLAFRKGRK